MRSEHQAELERVLQENQIMLDRALRQTEEQVVDKLKSDMEVIFLKEMSPEE